ncbi:MAG: SusD/RagB family nutrient-binding outer membrane lipoprotein [Tannerella sp.]|nr:SusD/RagB family nutrient-binding outer membrane lipoprotein [Tannerella sp.]
MNNMILINKIKKLPVYILSMVALVGCTDKFEEFNRDPSKPTDQEIMEGNYKLGAFFPQMLNYAYPAQENAYQMGENLIGDPYGRYLSIANSGFSSNFSIFNAPSGWINSPFNDVFGKVYGGWSQINQQTGGEGYLFAWAEIIRVTAMQRLTDMYGPLPYSQLQSRSIAVAYDSQEEVYNGMFKDLDNAIAILTDFVQENPSYRGMATFDQVYASDFSKWIKYANSLKLRLAVRIAYANPALAQQKAEEAVKHSIGVMTSNDDNAENPFPKNPIWTVTNAWGDSRACADIVAYMVGYNDPRISKYFTETTLEGAVDGYLGVRTGYSLPEKVVTSKYSSTTYAQTDLTLWMPSSETAFLKAEGALRGWDMGGTVKDLYEEGIRLSFTQWNAGGVDSYLEDGTSKPADFNDPDPAVAAKAISTMTIKWDDAANFETKLERLITQKWIAMYPLGQEAWSDNRRTGYPRFFPVLVNASDDPNLTTRLASRIPFPPDEAKNNTENYKGAVQLLGGEDKYGTKLWWDKNPNKGW